MESEEIRPHFPLSTFHVELLILSVQRMATATAAELFELQPVRRVLFVLGRRVVAFFALSALQNNIISRHFLVLRRLPLALSKSPRAVGFRLIVIPRYPKRYRHRPCGHLRE